MSQSGTVTPSWSPDIETGWLSLTTEQSKACPLVIESEAPTNKSAERVDKIARSDEQQPTT